MNYAAHIAAFTLDGSIRVCAQYDANWRQKKGSATLHGQLTQSMNEDIAHAYIYIYTYMPFLNPRGLDPQCVFTSHHHFPLVDMPGPSRKAYRLAWQYSRGDPQLQNCLCSQQVIDWKQNTFTYIYIYTYYKNNVLIYILFVYSDLHGFVWTRFGDNLHASWASFTYGSGVLHWDHQLCYCWCSWCSGFVQDEFFKVVPCDVWIGPDSTWWFGALSLNK
jgi:hypothetical protein